AFSLNNNNLNFVTSSNYPWRGTNNVSFDGVASATSGNQAVPNSTSWLQTTVVGPGIIGFWWKVDSDVTWPTNIGSFDYFGFLVNGVQEDMIEGQVDWEHRSYYIPAGTNVLTWQYVKDSQYNSGYDHGWLDVVTWQPQTLAAPAQTFNTCGIP